MEMALKSLYDDCLRPDQESGDSSALHAAVTKNVCVGPSGLKLQVPTDVTCSLTPPFGFLPYLARSSLLVLSASLSK